MQYLAETHRREVLKLTDYRGKGTNQVEVNISNHSHSNLLNFSYRIVQLREHGYVNPLKQRLIS